MVDLNKLKIQHYYCEDSRYSCPLSSGGCADDSQGKKCNCDAEEHNKNVDELIKELSRIPCPDALGYWGLDIYSDCGHCVVCAAKKILNIERKTK